MFKEDVINQIFQNFGEEEIKEVLALLTNFCNVGLNVENNQFARSVIFLAEGSLEKIKNHLIPAAQRDRWHNSYKNRKGAS